MILSTKRKFDKIVRLNNIYIYIYYEISENPIDSYRKELISINFGACFKTSILHADIHDIGCPVILCCCGYFSVNFIFLLRFVLSGSF